MIKKKSNVEKIIIVLSLVLSAFQLYTAAIAPMQSVQQRAVHLFFIFPLGFLYEAQKYENKKSLRIGCYLLALVSAAASLYVSINWLELQNRTTQLLPSDYIFAIALIAVILVITQRTIGWCMPIIAIVFIVYSFTGQYLGGVFKFSAISLRRFIASVFCGTEGIFGTCLGAAATYVFMFIMFGEFLSKYSAGDFFVRLSEAAFGRMRGSSGKIAIITSALFGMISGSPTANVAATGCLTIPMMRKSGYKPEYSGGIVAAASAGGSICPPVMGTGAYVMAEMTGMSYGSICLAAALPAALYFMSLFLMVDIHAIKHNIAGSDVPPIKVKDALKEGWHYLLSIIVMILFLIILNWSPAKSSVISIAVLVLCDYARKLSAKEKHVFKPFYEALISSCKSAVTIASVTACAGLIIGCFNATGLNLRLSSMLIELSGGSTLALLILAAIGALILGMGLPATPAYILMAVMIAPALTSLGISKLAAHMFVFYYGAMAPITPPEGTAFYISANLAGAKPMKTGFMAMCTALVAFLLPFIWVYEPALLLDGAVVEVLVVIITTIIGTSALAFGLEGYLFGHLNAWKRILLILASVTMVIPNTICTIIGISAIAILAVVQLSVRQMPVNL